MSEIAIKVSEFSSEARDMVTDRFVQHEKRLGETREALQCLVMETVEKLQESMDARREDAMQLRTKLEDLSTQMKDKVQATVERRLREELDIAGLSEGSLHAMEAKVDVR